MLLGKLLSLSVIFGFSVCGLGVTYIIGCVKTHKWISAETLDTMPSSDENLVGLVVLLPLLPVKL